MMKNSQNYQITQIQEMLDDEESPFNKVLNVLRKPSSVIIMVLVSVILFLSLKFGHLQHELDSISR